MADQIATRYGILPEDISRAALQTIVLAAADAIDALEEAHQWLQRVGVPDDHAGQLSPRQRWEQLLRNLFPASILVVDPRGSASPELVALPTASNDIERAVGRLLNAGASFLLSQATTLDDAIELERHWQGSTPADETSVDAVEVLLRRVSRASRTLLDHAETGDWRNLLATFAPQPTSTAPPLLTLQELSQEVASSILAVKKDCRFFVTGPVSAGKSNIFHSALSTMRLRWPERFDAWRTQALNDLCLTRINLDAPADTTTDSARARSSCPTSGWWERIKANMSRTATTPWWSSYPMDERSRFESRYEQHWHDLNHRLQGLDRSRGISDLVLGDYGMSSPGLSRSPLAEGSQPFALLQSLLMAVELLGSDDGEAKLAGLAQVRAFGAANPDHQQLVVNVLCGYLRTPTATELVRDSDEWRFRVAVQTTLAHYLRPGPQHPPDQPWDGMDLDLDNAVLADLDWADCHIRSARFTGARFYGDAVFTGVRFGCILFDRALFVHDAVFENVVFNDAVRFEWTRFSGDTIFQTVHFNRDSRFDSARFDGDVEFNDAVFQGDARFVDTEFCGDAMFNQTRSYGLARFERARFLAGAQFLRTSGKDLDAVLLAHDPGWVRTDTPANDLHRVWPAGWTVRPTPDQPRGEYEGEWGRLVPDLPTAV